MEKAQISHSEGGSMYSGKAAVDVFACYVTAHGMKLFAKTGIRPCRGWTPKIALAFVEQRTGIAFKRKQLAIAAQFLIMWANAKRAGIEEISTRPVDYGHCYSIARWGCDDKAEIEEMVNKLKLRGIMLLDEIDRVAEKHGLDDPLVELHIESQEMRDHRRKAVANIREMVAGLEAK